jgi:hypothetical protein
VWAVAVVGDYIIGHSTRWVTEQAKFVRREVTISIQVTFVRDELPLQGTDDGVVVMLAAPGERVGKGQSYALVCQNGKDAEQLSRRSALEQRLAWLRETSDAANYRALNAEQLSRQVDDTFAQFLRALDRGDCAGLAEPQEVFLHRATTLQVAMGSTLDLAGELKEAQRQLDALAQQAAPERFTQLTAPDSGEYYGITDGFETVLNPAALKNLTPESCTALLQRKAAPQAEPLGKLVKGFRWYAVALVPPGEAQQLREGAEYKVMFPQESARAFILRAERIRRGSGAQGQALVIFSCDEKDGTIQCLRGAKAEITLETVEGLEVPAAALRFLEKGAGQQKRPFTGVYIIRAGKPLLREAEVLYQDSKTAVVAWGGKHEAQAVSGGRVTVRGRLGSVTSPGEGQLRIIGQELSLVAEALDVKPAIPGGPTTQVTAQRRLFNETLLTGSGLQWKQEGNVLIVTGSGFAYREQRDTGLKIHDSVLVEGRIPEDDTTTISAGT